MKKGIVRSVTCAIEDGIARRFDSALLRACIALDATAKRRANTLKSSRSDFKELIRQYVWLLHMMNGGGIDLEKTRFTNVPIVDDRGRVIPDPDFSDVVYHAYRCALVHEGDVAEGYELIESNEVSCEFFLAQSVLHMPTRIVWGLVAISVFAECNADLSGGEGLHLNWRASNSPGSPIYTFDITQWWGKEKDVRAIYDDHDVGPIVEMNLGTNGFKS